MPKWGEVKARWPWLLSNLQDDEPVLFKLPRREAKRNIKNLEKCKRIFIGTDEQNFAEFAAIKEAYMLALHENPTLVVHAMIQAMRTFDVRGWYENETKEIRQ